MLLVELFDHKGPSLQTQLRNAVLDLLTPLSSHGATEVDIDTIVNRLHSLDLGIEITPDVIKDCVTPDSIPFVTKVDDTTIYLNGSEPDDMGAMADPDAPEPVDPVENSAKKQAIDDMKPAAPGKPKLDKPF